MIIEAVREAARHGTEEPNLSVKDWALDLCGRATIPVYPAVPMTLGVPLTPEPLWRNGRVGHCDIVGPGSWCRTHEMNYCGRLGAL
jgi:hypothetical protein